jgi:hypothetical protein
MMCLQVIITKVKFKWSEALASMVKKVTKSPLIRSACEGEGNFYVVFICPIFGGLLTSCYCERL